MKKYNPFKAPDPKRWLELDESERIDLVIEHHRRARVKLPNHQVHAAFHVIIENQIAMGEDIPARTLKRLFDEGLNRHDAIHAISTVLMELMFDSFHDEIPSDFASLDMKSEYYEALEELTAQDWLEY